MTAFWMTWKPEGWPLEQLRDLVQRFERDSSADEPWRIIAHKRAKVGDRVFAFKQGSEPRGIFGVGTITAPPSIRPELSPHSEQLQYFAPVHFTSLVDPTDHFLLPLEDMIEIVPGRLIRAQASGYPMPPDAAASIAVLLGLPDTGDVAVENLRNPPWNRDELILALDAYVRWSGNPPSKTSSEIEDLSRTMNDLRRILGTRGQATLRNVNGVYMKLMNFRRFDPAFVSQGKSGLTRGNRLEEEVWNEFHDDASRHRRVADAIRKALSETIALGTTTAEGGEFDLPGEEEAIEGRLLTVQHHRRERSRNIVLAKKAAATKVGRRLECEVCGFDFRERYGVRGEGFIECHHIKPVADLGDGTPTRLSDLALLCANCHRMVHARRPWLTVEQLRASLLAMGAPL